MMQPLRVPIVILVVLAGAALVQGGRAISHQRSQLQALQREADRLKMQLDAQRREHDAGIQERILAELQLAELTGPPNSALSDTERARETEIAAWLVRVKQLRQLFEKQPDQRIALMRLLTDDDWLRVGKQRELDNEENIRKSLAAVRSAATSRFTHPLANALRKFAKAANGEPPGSIQELAPYLENPADAEFLPHFEIIPVNRSGESARRDTPRWAVQEKAAVDIDYDSRLEVHSNGGSSISPAPLAWIPNFQEQRRRAYGDFSTANKGIVPAGIEQLIPYFSPPLDPVLAENVIKAERAGWR